MVFMRLGHPYYTCLSEDERIFCHPHNVGFAGLVVTLDDHNVLSHVSLIESLGADSMCD